MLGGLSLTKATAHCMLACKALGHEIAQWFNQWWLQLLKCSSGGKFAMILTIPGNTREHISGMCRQFSFKICSHWLCLLVIVCYSDGGYKITQWRWNWCTEFQNAVKSITLTKCVVVTNNVPMQQCCLVLAWVLVCLHYIGWTAYISSYTELKKFFLMQLHAILLQECCNYVKYYVWK